MKEKNDQVDRRKFLSRVIRLSTVSAATVATGFWLHGRSRRPREVIAATTIQRKSISRDPNLPEYVVTHGDNPAELVKSAVAELGGIGRFIAPGDVVIVKPNIAWDRTPEQAANTNPEVVGAIVRLCVEAGAKKVIVTDVSCNDARRCYQRSGIARAATEAGGEVVFPERRKFKKVDMHGDFLGVWPVFEPFLTADKVINVPVAKHHKLTRVTLGMKNWYGVIGGARHRLHQRIHESIVDLAAFMQPALTIIDAYRVLMRNGPTGGSLRDVAIKKTLIAGTDPVAVDAYAAQAFWNIPFNQLPFLLIGEARGLGKADFNSVRHKILEV